MGIERQIEHADDGVHRRADLVAHVGQKAALGQCGRLGPLSRPLQLALGTLALLDVALDRARHFVERRAEHLQLLHAVQGADARAIVALDQLSGRGAQPRHRTQDIAIEDVQTDGHQRDHEQEPES